MRWRRRPVQPDRFTLGPTSGLVSGWVGLVFAVVIVVVALLHGVTRGEWRVIACACFVAAACWALMMRPRVVFESDILVLRNMLSDVHIPYGRLRSVSVRTVTRATTSEGRRYVGLAVGRTRKEMAGPPSRERRGFLDRRLGISQMDQAQRPSSAATGEHIPDLVERLAEDRIAQAPPGGADAPVRRLVAVPEVAALLLTIAGIVVAFVL